MYTVRHMGNWSNNKILAQLTIGSLSIISRVGALIASAWVAYDFGYALLYGRVHVLSLGAVLVLPILLQFGRISRAVAFFDAR